MGILTLCDEAQVDVGVAEPRLVLDLLVRPRLVRQRNEAALVVGARSLVVDGHETIALEVRDWRNGRVDGELGVVDTETVT